MSPSVNMLVGRQYVRDRKTGLVHVSRRMRRSVLRVIYCGIRTPFSFNNKRHMKTLERTESPATCLVC